ncbi:MAG: response regulator [Deltaproteobacteria bacterium]|nr:response regulator [Deltaproteobacteria bacterium]
MTRELLGKILVDSGKITEEQLAEALARQKTAGRRLGRTLLEMGAIDEATLVLVLAQQGGFAQIDPRGTMVDPDLLDKLPQTAASRLGALPLDHAGPHLVRVAMRNPLDLEARRDVEFALGKAILPLVSRSQELDKAIAECYGLEQRLGAILEAVERPSTSRAAPTLAIDVSALERGLKQGGLKPYVDLVNFLLANAHAARASDIHFESQEGGMRVRYRIDGELRPVMTLPKWVERGLISRIKVVGEMDVSNRREPQEGKVRAVVGSEEMDLRVSILPSQFGETCVIRVLNPGVLAVDLTELGFTAAQLQGYYRLISQPEGMLLVTGPTGSGKSTTLYASIKRLRASHNSIVTVEDPVEYSVPGITQVQVDERRAMTFSTSVRWLLRQDPNVLVIGEIRDRETAATACEAALTGHLVLSTLHTRDCLSTITRLRDLGVPHYLTSTTLLGVVAQRLVRKLCPSCRRPGQPDPAVWRKLELEPVALPGSCLAGPGCPDCQYTGYRGRIGVYEVLRIDDALRELMRGGADVAALRRAAGEGALAPWREGILEKVHGGVTSLEEVVRHLDPQSLAGLSAAAPPLDGSPEQRSASRLSGGEPGPAADTSAALPRLAAATDAAGTGHQGDVPVDVVATVEVLPPSAPTRAETQPEGRTILAVDDSEEVLTLVGYTLEGVGYRVLKARDGRSALELVDKQLGHDPVHLVVLDVMMPDMSGFEVAKKLKENIATAFLPVLILSARGEQAYVKEGFRAGADDYLPKPFDPEELELRVGALLRRAYRELPASPEPVGDLEP